MKAFLSICILLMGFYSHASTCDHELKSEIPIFQTALDNLYSFTYVRQNLMSELNAVPGSEFCVSSIALGNNIYQYLHYFIEVEVRKPVPLKSRYYHFLFQDASVQAFHNIGGQPWTGLDNKVVAKVASDLITQAHFAKVNSKGLDILELAKSSRSFLASVDKTDLQTLSSVQIQSSPEKVFLVTWLSLPNENPFLYPVIPRGVLISVSPSSEVQMAEDVSPTSDFWMPLSENITKINNKLSRDQTVWLKKLNEISN